MLFLYQQQMVQPGNSIIKELLCYLNAEQLAILHDQNFQAPSFRLFTLISLMCSVRHSFAARLRTQTPTTVAVSGQLR